MKSGETAQLVTENKQRKIKKFLNNNYIFSKEIDAKIGAVIIGATAAGILVYAVGSNVNNLNNDKSYTITDLASTLVTKSNLQDVDKIVLTDCVITNLQTYVGSTITTKGNDVDGYFTIDKSVQVNEDLYDNVVPVSSLDNSTISKLADATNNATITWTEGKLADKTNYVMED